MTKKSSGFLPVLLKVLVVLSVTICLSSCNSEPGIRPQPQPEQPEKPQTTFPAGVFRKFLDERFIPVEIPSPVTTGEWYVGSVWHDDDYGTCFLAEVEIPDQGEIGVDSMEDIYKAQLEADGWDVRFSGDDDHEYIAVKEDVTLKFYSAVYVLYDTQYSGFTIIIFAEERKVPVYAESFSISGRSSVMLGRTTLLDIVTEPLLANQRTCEWTSSDNGTATVEDGVVRGLALGSVTITARLKNEAGEYIEQTFDIDVTENTPGDWTVMVYFCGADLESSGRLASKDIDEILSVPGQPDDINIIIQTGGASKWENPVIDSDYLCRFHIEDGKLVPDDRLESASMGDPETLIDFMTWGMTSYPADKSALILWDHGSGMNGVCFDELFQDDSLKNSELSYAFSTVFDNLGLEEKLEFIGYDACLMQYQDAAGINSKHFRYMVGSEEVSTGLGWEYEEWVDDLYAGKNTETILKEIASSYNAAFGKKENIAYIIGWKRIQTQSVLDLTVFDVYHESFEALAGALADMPGFDIDEFRDLMKTVKRYGIDTEVEEEAFPGYLESGYLEEWFYDGTDVWGDPIHVLPSYYDRGLFDAMDFLNKLGEDETYNQLDGYIAAARAALEDMLICNETGENAGQSYGLALYCPIAERTRYYEEETVFSVWWNLVKMSENC